MTTLTRNTVKTNKPALRNIWLVGMSATVIATTLNAVLYLAGGVAAAASIALSEVLAMTSGAGIAATLGYTLLTRLLSPSVTHWVMIGVAAAVLLGMAGGPFSLGSVPLAQIAVLEVMHLVAGVTPVYALLNRAA